MINILNHVTKFKTSLNCKEEKNNYILNKIINIIFIIFMKARDIDAE